MATTAGTLITAAIDSSLANDQGITDLANDTTELLDVLNRKIRQIYTLAGMPKWAGGMGKGDYFATSAPVTLGAAPVALPAAAFRHIFTTTAGVRVATISRADLVDGVAEMPPAVLIEQQKILSAGRPGDPVNGETLTVYFTPIPALLTAASHYVGASTPSDASTSQWPDWVGDPFLVAWLARYLAFKAADRDPGELAAIQQDLVEAAIVLGSLIEVDATRLVQDVDREDDAA